MNYSRESQLTFFIIGYLNRYERLNNDQILEIYQIVKEGAPYETREDLDNLSAQVLQFALQLGVQEDTTLPEERSKYADMPEWKRMSRHDRQAWRLKEYLDSQGYYPFMSGGRRRKKHKR